MKNPVDTGFFTPDVCAARRPKPPLILHRLTLAKQVLPSRKRFIHMRSMCCRPGERHRRKDGKRALVSKRKGRKEHGQKNPQSPDRHPVGSLRTDFVRLRRAEDDDGYRRDGGNLLRIRRGAGPVYEKLHGLQCDSGLYGGFQGQYPEYWGWRLSDGIYPVGRHDLCLGGEQVL